ncbi:MAG: hypothetical protein AAFP69_17990, partial [Planctomycetota bacterium]
MLLMIADRSLPLNANVSQRCLFHWLTRLVLLLCTVITVCGIATAQDEPAGGEASPADDANQFAGTELPLSEQTIYIPYEKLQSVFEAEGRGVFLPYEKFNALWAAARRAEQQKQEDAVPVNEKPPADAVISSIESNAVVVGDVMRVNATLQIEALKLGWISVPLRLKGAAIQSATIDDQPARILASRDGGYRLLYRSESRLPIQLELQYAAALTKTPGKNSVQFAPPMAPINRWQITVDQPDIEIDVQPAIAVTRGPQKESQATASTAKDTSDQEGREPDGDASADESDEDESNEDESGEGDSEDEPSDDDSAGEGKSVDDKSDSGEADEDAADDQQSVVLAFVGSTPNVSIAWTPKSEGASGLSSIVT